MAERLPAEKSNQGAERDSLALADGAPRAQTARAQGDQGLLALQRRAGNRTVLAYLGIQAKLEVGRADDPLEVEADAVASRVVHALRSRSWPVVDPAMSPAGSSSPAGDEEPARRLLRRWDAAVGPEGGQVDAESERAIAGSGGRGRSLPEGTLQGMGMAFGADFSAVRVHEGPVASALNERLGAKAFTRGSDIFFRDGLPDTSRADGQHLLAHELAHTVQQGAARRVARSRIAGGTVGLGIQRLFSGYYVVCKADDPGATKIDNDTHKPKRFYRTVASVSSKATKAEKQPFKLWNLWDDPEASTLPAKAVEPEEIATDETDDVDEPGDVDETTDVDETPPDKAPVGTGSKKKKKKKSKKKKTGESGSPTGTVTTPTKAKVEPTGPPEEAWKATYRSTAPATGLKGAFLEENLKYIEKQIQFKQSALDTAVKELEDAWRDEFEAAEGATTLAERQAELLADMPSWSGNAATLVKSLNSMDTAVARAKWAVTDAKAAGKLGDDIGSEGLTEMLSVFDRDDAVKYAKDVGTPRLRILLVDKHVPAAVLKHYQAPMMRGFIGADKKVWTHLVTASLNSAGAVSGGHDDQVFRAFIKKKKYTITDDPFAPPEPDPDADEDAEPPPPVVVPTVYKVHYANESGVVLGSKTLIQNLTTTKQAWMTRFNEAVWHALINQRLSDGSFWGRDSQGDLYDGFYARDAFEVDTVWPN